MIATRNGASSDPPTSQERQTSAGDPPDFPQMPRISETWNQSRVAQRPVRPGDTLRRGAHHLAQPGDVVLHQVAPVPSTGHHRQSVDPRPTATCVPHAGLPPELGRVAGASAAETTSNSIR
jgi:hypothetical protein